MREFYEKAMPGIPMLNPEGRFAVRIAADVYRQILNRIEDSDYDVFERRAIVPATTKYWLTAKSMALPIARQSLHRLAGLAHHVLHLAPPAQQGSTDERTRHLVRALSKAGLPRSLVYVSTSGVYGDCGGDWIREERMANPQTPRARRRVHAERLVRNWGRTQGVRVSVLRVPGIYANDRAEGGAHARLERRLPVLLATEDVYTNHIHADDLARACQRAIWLARPQRVYNVNDDTCLKMGDYFDSAADLYGLDRPPRVPRTELQNSVSAMQLSFMSESRRMRNERMKQELRLLLAYPSVHDGLRGFCRIRISRRDTRSESPQMHPDGPAADRPGRVRTAVPVPPG